MSIPGSHQDFISALTRYSGADVNCWRISQIASISLTARQQGL